MRIRSIFLEELLLIYPVDVHDSITGQYVYDELGNKRYDTGNLSSEFGLSRPFNSGRHAIAENLWNIDNSKRDFLGARAYVDFIINPYFTFTTSLSADITNQNSEEYQNTIVGDGAPAGRYNQTWSRTHGITFNQILRFNKSFGDHNVNALLGHESFDYRFNDVYGMRQGEGFAGFYTFTNFTDISSLTSGLAEAAMESFFSRANYDYKNKYYLSASVRYDGDSKLPDLNRWAPFWSLGVAWRIEKEDFFNADWVELLKLRASYGRLGNNDIGNYPYQPGYGIGNNNAAAPGSVLTALGSPDLKWEGQKPLDIGLDFSFLDGRVSGAFDYYNRVSDGLLFSVRQPYHNGGTTGGSFAIDKNVGDMKNSGIEVQVTGNIVRKEDFNWNLSVNLSTHKNKILKMPKETPEIVSSPYKRAEGKSLYEYFTRKFYGIDPDNGEVMYLGVTAYDVANAKIKIIDKGNGVMDTVTYDQNLAKQDWIGKSALPTAYGSISNNLRFKNFDFGFTVLYSMGGWANDSQYGGLMSPGPSNGANIHRDLFNGWRAPGDVTNIPRMDVNKTSEFGAASSRFLTKADYLSISNVNLSYTLPKEWLSKLDVNGARLFVSGENLHFFTKRKGMDTAGSFTGVASNSSYSAARTFTFGINLNL